MKLVITLVSLLLLAGCASTRDAGEFVGTAAGAGFRAAIADREVVVIREHDRGWRSRQLRVCSYWRNGRRIGYDC